MTSAARHGDIVVGVDGSDMSVAALRWAVAEAAVSGRTVRAVRAWTFDPQAAIEFAVAGSPDEIQRRYHHELDTLVRNALSETEAATVRRYLVEGAPSEALARACHDASMLVLGSHGHGRLLHLLVGSVAAQCLRDAVCPVVIIPARTVVGLVEQSKEALAGTYQPSPLL